MAWGGEDCASDRIVKTYLVFHNSQYLKLDLKKYTVVPLSYFLYLQFFVCLFWFFT